MATGDITTSDSGIDLVETEDGSRVSMYECLLCGAKQQYHWPRTCCDGVDRTKMTFIQMLQLALPGAVYDTALPQNWYDDVLKRTGVNPSGQFVWLYDDMLYYRSLFGKPMAITNLAQWLVNSGQVDALIVT